MIITNFEKISGTKVNVFGFEWEIKVFDYSKNEGVHHLWVMTEGGKLHNVVRFIINFSDEFQNELRPIVRVCKRGRGDEATSGWKDIDATARIDDLRTMENFQNWVTDVMTFVVGEKWFLTK